MEEIGKRSDVGGIYMFCYLREDVQRVFVMCFRMFIV